ncbi:MAG: carboxypeptidase regulatory-like domain-containing protein [Thermoguttaceae bacterium]|nr:carboxypeptidase regulatory-like domain-containing protein [Thermoguttaceae bacterium]
MDLHLRSDSIAIDKGDNTAIANYETDIEGNARIYGETVDIGAYEYQGDRDDEPYSTVVNTLNDSFDLNDDEWSLREAISYASEYVTITFADELEGTIVLSLGELDIEAPLAIDGDNHITIDADQKSRVLLVNAGTASNPVRLDNLTIQNGTAENGGGICIESGYLTITNSTISGNTSSYGGGIANYGTTTITNSTISGNTSEYSSGGIANYGTTTITNSTISGNTAEYGSGGIYNGSETLTITNSEISGNTASNYHGGGINNASGILTVTNSTISENTASSSGGGIFNYSGTLMVTNSTISGNTTSSYDGGGIYNGGYSGTATLTITNSTISGNTASSEGGGIYNNGTTNIYNTIVAANTASNGTDVYKSSGGSINAYNSLSSYTAWNNGSDNIVYDPNQQLFVDAENDDHRLVKGSQAFDKGNNQYAYNAGMDELSTDIIGMPRFIGNNIDIGAYEYFGINSSQDGIYIGNVTFSWTQYKNTANVRLTWISGTFRTVLGTFESVGEYTWDTTAFADGYGQLTVEYLDKNGSAILSSTVTGLILNDDSVVVHRGDVSAPETWSADKVHLVAGRLEVLSGGSVTVTQNAVVKFWKNAYLYANSEATITVQDNVVFTRVEDDEVAGDTNLDGDLTVPKIGNAYIRGNGMIDIAESVNMKYVTITTSGIIFSNETWFSGQVYRVTGDVTVANGATLTIQPGAIVKFNSGTSLIVQSGGTLNAQGTVAQPIVFTSIKDDEYGGDTNEDDGFYSPAAGDWTRIACTGGTIVMDHCKVMYGGNTPSSNGALYLRQGTWELKNSWVSQSKYTAIHLEAGSFSAENTIICDSLMGVNVHYFSGPESSSSRAFFTNCTISDLTDGIRMHGTGTFTNCIIANISSQFTLNNNSSTRYQNCIFWNPTGFGPQTCQYASGTNRWANPLFRNASAGDYYLMAGSPCIDAGTSDGAPETDITGAPRANDPYSGREGVVDIGAYEFVDGVVSAIDLEPVNVQAPSSVTTGEAATIQWTIRNNGSAAASGSWTDAIYLVNDISGQSVLVKECVHAGDIAPGDLQTFYTDVVVPAVVEGAWKVQIRVNPNREIFEGVNIDNNFALAESSTVVQTPFLTDSQGVISAKKNQAALYRVTVNAGDSFSLQISSEKPISIYMRENYVPNASNYDFAGVEYQPNCQTLFIASADTDRTFYLLAETTADAAGIEYAIQTNERFDILGVAPATVSNAGSSTVTVSGVGFTSGMTAQLVLNNTVINASTVNVVSASSAALTFDLTAQPAGQYTLRMTLPNGQIDELANALTVEQNGIGAKLEIDLQLPESVRTGRVYEGKLIYANNGDCDMLVPIFTIYSDSVPLALNTNELGSEKELNVLGLGKEDSAGILRAGESGVITFYFKAGTNNKIHAYTWGIAGAMAANDSWESWSELFADISNAATQLGLRGCRDYNFNTAKQLAKAKKQDSACTGLAGYLTDSRNGSPLTNCTLILEWTEDEQTQFAQSVTDSDGHYVFNFVPKNSQCSLSILDGAYCLSKESVVIETNDQTSFNLTALPYGTISGRITDATNSQAVSGIVIHAQDENGNIVFAETDQRGCYVLNNLELGSWTITADTTGKFHSLSPVIQTVNSSESQCVNIQLDPGASISGTIVDSENNPVSGLTIYINDSAGLFFTIQTDEYGRYSAGGMSEGEIVLDFTGSSCITVEDATVEVFEHSTVVQDFQFEIGASLSGSVLNVYQQPVENAILLAKNASGSSWVAITDETGVWAISGLPVDEYTVTLYTQSLLYNQQSTIQIDSVSDFVQNFVWVETGSLSGQVVNADGRIGRGNVIVTGNSEVATFIETDLNGNFTLGDLIPGVYTLYLADESGLSYSFEIEANKNTYKVVDINVAATVAGSTKDVNGNAVPDVYVQVYQNGEVLFTTQSDEDGAFNFAFTESGVYDFYAFTYDGSQFSSFENVVIDNGDAKNLDFVEGTYTLTISDLLGLPEDSEVKDGMTYTIMRYNSSDNSPVGMIFSSDSQVFMNLANGAYEITAQNGDYLAETTIVIENESKQISLQPELLNSLTINFELPDESIELDSIGVFGLYNSDNELLKLVYFDSLDSFELHAIRNGEYKVIALSGSYGVFQDLTINDSNESVTLSLSELNSSVSGSIRDISSGYLYVTDEDGVIQGFGCTQADGSFEIFTVSEIANGFVVDNGTNRKIAALENGLDNLAIPKSPVLGMNVTAVTPVAMAAFSDIFELKIDKLIRENNSLYWEVNSYTPSASHCSCNDLKFKSLSALKDRAFTYWKSASDNAITSSNARGDLLLKDSLIPKVTFYTTLFIVDLIGMTTHNPWASATSITLSVLNDFVNSDKTMEDLTFDIGAAVQSNFCYQGVPALANSVTIANDLRAFYSLKSDIKKFWSLRSDDVLIREYTNYYKEAEKYYKLAQMTFDLMKNIKFDNCCLDNSCCTCGCSLDENPDEPDDHNNSNVPQSSDPNEIIGPIGGDFVTHDEGTEDEPFMVIDGANWITNNPNQENEYKIYFENKSTATAAAQEIYVSTDLPAEMDWDSFQVDAISIGNEIYTLTDDCLIGENTWLVNQSSTGEQIKIRYSIDSQTGEVLWYLRSYVASTADNFPASAYDGFLPPNDDAHSGEGYIAYRVRYDSDLTTGDVVSTSATIVFDSNEPIETNVWLNTIDVDIPVVQMDSAELVGGGVALAWSGSDVGSGIEQYQIYVSADSGAYTLWQSFESDVTSAIFDTQTPGEYSFYILAVDRAGNIGGDPEQATPSILIESDMEMRVVTTSAVHASTDVISDNLETITDWDAFYMEFWTTNLKESQAGKTSTAKILYDSNVFQLDANQAIAAPAGITAEISDPILESNGMTSVIVTFTVGEDGYTAPGANTYWGAVHFTPNTQDGAGIQNPLESETLDVEMDGAASGTTVKAMPYDLNRDGKVNVDDFILFATVYGTNTDSVSTNDGMYTEKLLSDYDGDGAVSVTDFIAFATNYGLVKGDGKNVTLPQQNPQTNGSSVPNNSTVSESNLVEQLDTYAQPEPAASPIQQASEQVVIAQAASPVYENAIVTESELKSAVQVLRQAHSSALLDLYDNQNQSDAPTALFAKAVDESLGFDDDSFDFLFDESDSDADDSSDVDLSAVLDELELELI